MLKTELRSYQAEDLARIEQNDAYYLAYDMGCGKSIVPVAYIDKHRPKMSLIMCPKSVVRVWPREFQKHLTEDSNIHVVTLDRMEGRKTDMTGVQKLEYAREQWKRAEMANWPVVFVINYESARIEPIASKFISSKINWDLVICDEIHRCKSPRGTTSRFIGQIAKVANKRIGLSGTPMPHSPLDVWAQYKFLNKNIFGWSFTQFKSRYAVMGGFRHMGRPVQVVDYKNLDELNRKFYSIATRVKKEEVLTLKEPQHVERFLALDAKSRKHYDDLEEDLITDVDSDQCVAANAMVKVTRLQQVTSGYAKLDTGEERELHKLKGDALIDLLEDLDEKEPVVVFGRFHWDLKVIEEVAKKLDRPFYGLWHGRNDVGAIWEPQPGGILGVQIQAGGIGIDLTAAAYNVYLSQTWNMGDYDQSLARSHRHGQDRQVIYVHLLVENSVDEKIRKALAKRATLIEGTLSQSDLNSLILDQFRSTRNG